MVTDRMTPGAWVPAQADTVECYFQDLDFLIWDQTMGNAHLARPHLGPALVPLSHLTHLSADICPDISPLTWYLPGLPSLASTESRVGGGGGGSESSEGEFRLMLANQKSVDGQ